MSEEPEARVGRDAGRARVQRDACIVDALAEHAWTLCDGFLSSPQVEELAGEARRLEAGDVFRDARVGRGPSLRLDTAVRTDRVAWIAWDGASRALRRYYDRMQELRLTINRELQLGLFGFEAHFAVYEPGTFYRTHFDRFRGAEHRVLSAVAYLNRDWHEEDGGALRLYVEGVDDAAHVDVAPLGGRLVLFASERFAHEVLAARRQRLALTGWFTARSR